MSKSTTVSCTRDVKTQFEKFLSKSIDTFVSKLMEDDDEDTTEEHLRELFKECFSTKSFKITRSQGKTKRAKSDGPKAPSNAYIQWSNAEGREASKKNLEKAELKKLKKMSNTELEEKFNGETDHTKILKQLVSSKAIVANAAKMWKEHKEADDDTYTKFQTMYEKQKEAFQKQKESHNSTNSTEEEAGAAEEVKPSKAGGKKSKSKSKNTSDEVGPAETSSSGGKAKSKGGKKSKAKAKNTTEEENESVEVKTYSVADFEQFDGLSINLGMTVKGGLDTSKDKKEYNTLDEAVEALNEHDDAVAIHLDNKNKYTLRSTNKLVEAKSSQAPCVTWLIDDDEEDD